MNGDGLADMIVPCREEGSLEGGISVLFSNGNGTFQPAINSFALLSASTAVAGDYNGDGRIDIAFTSAITTEVAFGTAPGHFETAPAYATTSEPLAVFAGGFFAREKKMW